MLRAMSIYAVRIGRIPGIYQTWSVSHDGKEKWNVISAMFVGMNAMPKSTDFLELHSKNSGHKQKQTLF
jgi:hypothetical protein